MWLMVSTRRTTMWSFLSYTATEWGGWKRINFLGSTFWSYVFLKQLFAFVTEHERLYKDNFVMSSYWNIRFRRIHNFKYTDIPCYRGGRLKLRSLLLMKRIGSRTAGRLCSVLNSSIADPWWNLVWWSATDCSSNLKLHAVILKTHIIHHSKLYTSRK